MNAKYLLRLAGYLVLVGAGVSLIAAQEKKGAAESVGKASVETLIADLESENFKDRDAATRELLRRDDVMPSLYKAIIFPQSVEGEKRLRGILKQLEARHTPQRLQTLKELIKQGRVDEFVDLMAFLGERVDDESWQTLIDLGRRLEVAAQKEYRMRPPSFARVDEVLKRPGGFKRALHLSTLASPLLQQLIPVTQRLIVADDVIRFDSIVADSLVFSNADVCCDRISACIVICIVICDGTVQGSKPVLGSIGHSLVVATGTIKTGSTKVPSMVLVEKAQQFLGEVKFFDLQNVGINVSSRDLKLVVDSVTGKSPFGGCGIRRGDEIVAWNTTEIRSLDDFRRQVRQSATTTQVGFVTVERAGSDKLKFAVEFSK